ncbi:hypothetical protein [Sphingomonas sp.]|uniref:hypothetical protein n=1 Tax=Sphingomonas sp. TaxID=28214 RepID=UPI001B0D4B1A|nr:hypothetical protein [Sphingomonas sp.]MBO9713170.1 hypothetical protein [Sphingomonas sp.]
MGDVRNLSALAPLLLAACSTATQPPRIVEVPVPVACLPAAKIPDPPRFDAVALTGNAVHDLDLVTAHALRLRAWGEGLHAALVACAASPVR